MSTDLTAYNAEMRARRIAEAKDNPLPQPTNGTAFWDKTLETDQHHIPRPQRTDGRYERMPEAVRAEIVARDQESWDREHARRGKIVAHVAEINQRKQAEKDAETAAYQEQRDAANQEARNRLESRLRNQFLAVPGATVKDWEAIKDQRIADELQRLAAQQDADQRAAFMQRVRSMY